MAKYKNPFSLAEAPKKHSFRKENKPNLKILDAKRLANQLDLLH